MPVAIDNNLDVWINGRKLWMTLHIRTRWTSMEKTRSLSPKQSVVYFVMNGKLLAKHLGKDERSNKRRRL